MSTERTDQPSKVSTEEEVRPADEHVVTSDLAEDATTASPDDQTATPAASPDGEQTPPAAAADDTKQKPRRDRSAERRIGRLTKQIAQLSTARAEDRQQIETLTGQLNDLKQATAVVAPEPQLIDFATPKEYAKAYTKWEAGQSSPAPSADPAATAPPARDPTAQQPYETPNPVELDPEVKTFQSRGQEKLGDEFVEALEIEGTAVDVDMGEFLIDSDFGPEIYVHLAHNQEEAKKIYDSGAVRKVAALQELEKKAKAGELDVIASGDIQVDNTPPPGSTETTTPPPAKPKPGSRETAAPPPPEDTAQPGSANVRPDPENESMDDYAERRRKEEARRMGHIT